MEIDIQSNSKSPLEAFARTAGPRVEVEHRHGRRDQSFIPHEVVDAFTAQGKRVSLASSWPNAQSAISVNDRYPLVKEDLNSIARPKREKKGTDEGDPGFDPHQTMKVQGGFRINSDGYYMRGDCIVYIQTHDAYQYQLREAAAIWEAQDNPDTDRQHYGDLYAPFGQVGPDARTSLSRPIQRISDFISNPEEG